MNGAPPEAVEAERSAFVRGVLEGDRRALARTITLLESRRPDRFALGQQVLEALLPHTGGAHRLGITGTPGVGKSTFIEAFGLHLVGRGLRVAVLAVDPSSPVSGGSILGDKTRMEELSRHPAAFIRPSPSGGSLGGVAHRTREAMLVCEAAGFDVVLVETVGVGQSEVAVAGMVDLFAVLLQPGSGDELQGLKRGVLELADLLLVNKADGELEPLAERTRADYQRALSLLRPHSRSFETRVQCVSARTGRGVPEVWATVQEHRRALEESGELGERRREQACAWMWSLVDEELHRSFREHPLVEGRIAAVEEAVGRFAMTPAAGARELLELFRKG